MNKIIGGVGTDAEIITNKNGGKQAKAIAAMHLIDPFYLRDYFKNKGEELEYINDGRSTVVDDEDLEMHSLYVAGQFIAGYMATGIGFYLDLAMEKLGGSDENILLRLGGVLQEGATRYAPNNWRLIPEEEHLNHALIHIVVAILGDTQDKHIDHALTRIMMAKATDKSENFSYTEYIR